MFIFNSTSYTVKAGICAHDRRALQQIALNVHVKHFDLTWPDLTFSQPDNSMSVRSWCDGSSDRSFLVDPLRYFSFQSVLHDWCNKGHGMCYPVYGMVHIKEPLLLISNSSPCGRSRFPPLSYVQCHITVNKMCWVCC